jgi:hypothetical protein
MMIADLQSIWLLLLLWTTSLCDNPSAKKKKQRKNENDFSHQLYAGSHQKLADVT